MTHRQRNVIRRPRKLRLTDADRAVAVFLKPSEQLSNAEGSRTCNDPQLSISLPPSIARSQKLVLHRPPHGGGDQAYVRGLDGCSTGDGRSSQEDHATRRLLRIPFQKSVNDQPTQTVADKMQPAGRQAPYETLQARRNLRHRRRCCGIPERMHIHPELTRQPPAQQQRLATGHPQPMNVNYCFPHTSGQSWPSREISTGDDISKKWDYQACRRRASE
jgi:hypothetical protein